MTQTAVTDLKIRVSSNYLMLELLGERDAHLRMVEEAFPSARIVARGNELSISGAAPDAETVKTIIDEMLILVQEGDTLDAERVRRIISLVQSDVPSASGVLTAGVRVGHGKMVRAKTLGQKLYLEAIQESTLAFSIGPAGTGKTYLAMAAAVESLQSGSVSRIILTRPAVEAGERLGFLPGDLAAKIDPYLRPLYDALYEMIGTDETLRLIERGIIEIAPLAYMRGRTLNDAFIVLDEAQNTSPEQMKMFLTRLGFNSKMIITGDVTQIDLPDGRGSGLTIIGKILEGIPGVSSVELSAQDVVRHRIVASIVEAYRRYEAAQSSE